jgi:hypothetical protein
MSSLTRVLRTNPATISHTWWVGETPAAATGVTATVKRLDGTAIAGSPFASADAPDGTSTFTLPGQSNLDAYTIDWTATVAAAVRTERDYVEICGGYLFELREARTLPPALPANKYTTATLEALRVEVEQDIERICNTAFVPRFRRVALTGSGFENLATPDADLRVLRAVSVDGVAWSPSAVATVGVSESGVLSLHSGWWPLPWTPGRRNIVVEYEYGRNLQPFSVRRAGMIWTRQRAGLTDTTVPYRATSFTAVDGGVYRLATPSGESSGIPEVDAVLDRYQQDLGGFA